MVATAAELYAANAVVPLGVVVQESDTLLRKVPGDGVQTFRQLAYEGTTTVARQLDPDDLAGVMTTYLATAGRPAGVGICALGDSASANYGNDTRTGADGHLTWGLMKSGGLLPWRGVYATGGYTLEQIRDIKLPLVLALDPPPAVCVVLGGTNNVPDGTSTVVLEDIYLQLLKRGIRPVATTILPRGDSSPVNDNVDLFNQKVRRLAASLSLDLADYHKAVVNPTTGGFKTGLGQTDSIHPSFLGTIKMGEALAAVLTAIVPKGSTPLARRASEYGNLIGSAGLMLTDALGSSNNTAADGIADGWRNLGSGLNTHSITTDADGTKWQRVTIGTGGGGALLQYISGSGMPSLAAKVAAGDTVEFCYRVRTAGFEENFVAPAGPGVGGTGPVWSGQLLYLQTDGSTYGALCRNPYVGHGTVTDGVVWQRAVVPSDANGTLQVSFSTTGLPASGTLTLEVTGVAVRNLTTLGIA